MKNSTEDDLGSQSMDQDLDCWSDLWRLIKTNGSRFLRYFVKMYKETRSNY